MPRVITGKYRGANLFAPKGLSTRPTVDMVKGALFSSIGYSIEDSSFLDLFSGTGQMGIEALSRGASNVVLVEKGRNAIESIKRNLDKLRITEDEGLKLMCVSSEKALDILGQDENVFDYIFLDPPYDIAHKQAMLTADKINKYNLLSENGVMIVEHSSELPFNIDVINMQFERSCSYGLAVITFFRRNK